MLFDFQDKLAFMLDPDNLSTYIHFTDGKLS